MSNKLTVVLLAGGLVFTGAGGFLASTALSQDGEPTRTETITVRDGERGPAGPQGERGPAGPAGGTTCPDGYELGRLVINHPGGQVTILTCLAE